MSDDGYLSIVAIALKNAAADHNLFKKIDPNVKITIVGDFTFYEYVWTQWYAEQFGAIQDVMEYLESLGSTEYGFIRIGEMSDDIDRLGCPNLFDMHITTSIDLMKHSTIESKITAKVNELIADRNYCDYQCYLTLSSIDLEDIFEEDEIDLIKGVLLKRARLSDELMTLIAKGGK